MAWLSTVASGSARARAADSRRPLGAWFHAAFGTAANELPAVGRHQRLRGCTLLKHNVRRNIAKRQNSEPRLGGQLSWRLGTGRDAPSPKLLHPRPSPILRNAPTHLVILLASIDTKKIPRRLADITHIDRAAVQLDSSDNSTRSKRQEDSGPPS